MTCTWRSSACRSTAQVSVGVAAARGSCVTMEHGGQESAGTPGPGARPARELMLAFRRRAPSRRGPCSVWDQGISIPSSLPLAPLAQVPPTPPWTMQHGLWNRSSADGCQQLPPAATLKNQRYFFSGHQLAGQVMRQEAVLISHH